MINVSTQQQVHGRGVSAEHSGGYAWGVSSGDGGGTPTLTRSTPLSAEQPAGTTQLDWKRDTKDHAIIPTSQDRQARATFLFCMRLLRVNGIKWQDGVPESSHQAITAQHGESGEAKSRSTTHHQSGQLWR